jgi:hypothetical protein
MPTTKPTRTKPKTARTGKPTPVSAVEFYEKVARRPDVRRIMERLAK